MNTEQNVTTAVAEIGTGAMPSIDVEQLKAVGVTQEDMPVITDLAAKIDSRNPISVAEFGRDVAEHTSRYADSLLEQVRSTDLEETGDKLNQVVLAAKSLNLHALSDTRSKIPLIGKFIDRMKLSKEKFVGQFNTTKEQVDSLLAEVEKTQTGLTQRVHGLESMFDSVKEEFRLLGLHIAAGKMRLSSLREEAGAMRARDLSPAEVQELNDLENLIANLDKRVGDLAALQHSALQSLPMIRMIQANNHMLVEKFHTIRELTVPAWKRQFMLALSLNEQQNAVRLADSIDNATNDFLRRNAELLHKNSVDTAKANQRLVIDVATLEKVQATLISTVEDVIRIQQEGVRSRHEAETKLLTMRTDLENRLSRRSGNRQAA